MAAHTEPDHFRVTYQDVHNLIRESARKIEAFKPDIIIAIGLSLSMACNIRRILTVSLLSHAQVEGKSTAH